MAVTALLRVVRRRWWLILSLVLVTGLVLGFRLLLVENTYEAQIALQLTAPQQEDVTLFDRYQSASTRDEILVARRNLKEVLKSREVHNRTLTQLGLGGEDARYDVDVREIRDSDFIVVVVRARTADLAATIANAHVAAGTAYYGELRAKPASAAKAFLAEQLRVAGDKVVAAENAFVSSHSQLDELRLKQASAEYALFLEKYTEASLKENLVRTASFIQIVEPAIAPAWPAYSNLLALVGLALLGSLGLGVVVAFLLESPHVPGPQVQGS